MAYLEVVGGGNAGAEYSNAGKYEDAKVPEEHKRKFKSKKSERNAKACVKQRRPDKRDWRATKLVLSQVGHSHRRNKSQEEKKLISRRLGSALK